MMSWMLYVWVAFVFGFLTLLYGIMQWDRRMTLSTICVMGGGFTIVVCVGILIISLLSGVN